MRRLRCVSFEIQCHRDNTVLWAPFHFLLKENTELLEGAALGSLQ